jgi:hypothetical protein
MCKRSSAYLSGIQVTDTSYRYFDHYKLPCKSFQCPECSPQKTKVLKARIHKGRIKNSNVINKKYTSKFFTFTAPGNPWRQNHTPEQVLEIMQKNFNKLMTNIRRVYGDVDYFRVTEKHKSGYPHFHVLFVGLSIRPWSFKKFIERLWRVKYGMGFIKAKVIYDFDHGVNYLCKYLTKSMEAIKKHQRIFSSSRGALQPMIKKKSEWIAFRSIVFDCEIEGELYTLDFDQVKSLGILEAKIKGFEDQQELIEIIKTAGRKEPPIRLQKTG